MLVIRKKKLIQESKAVKSMIFCSGRAQYQNRQI